ncbi:hypothetical protein B5P44_00900 [Mycobacterium sp. CBMA 213]|uniref:Transposase n=1 Tax=Mycolicibacterium sp. CBMA 213 TaxID=1968788 RepID=A0A343VRG7_9MYCO|nr:MULTISPECIES: hypothetical protein [unclassified Mycolicibacterium]AVN58491.1 hypothetical protein B5P44_p00196 [Mycolicibacterium sp. CBMA 213]MUL61140.1 hypothetical protein [Mycolicibacterium sp. CBMA 335]MUM03378.1 hypothetical protein [Mycolicibacterium sp. CBMA 213]
MTGRGLRRIADPVVAAGPAGVRIRTRLQLNAGEASALNEVGQYLGSVYRGELAHRITLGHMDRQARTRWRTERKQAVTVVSSSRWAGALTRAVDDQYQLGMRALSAHVTDLRSAIDVIEKRCARRPGELDPAHGDGRARSRPVRGYATAAERFSKTRRLAILRQRLAAAEGALAAGYPSITVGGNRLWRTRQNLAAAQITEQVWRQRWDAARMFLTADGETGKTGGNETIRVDESGRLRIKVPAALADRFGTHLQLAAPVAFNHRAVEWTERVAGRRAVRYDITYDPDKNRWYLDASWSLAPEAPSDLQELRGGRVLGVDLNADHLAACVLDPSGNPVGEPVTITADTARLRASRRDGRVRAAITALLDHATTAGCTAIVVENLDFADARATGRETMGRGKRGKAFRRTVAGIPTAKFRDRLTAMATRRGIHVIGVDPAYTSRWGRQHWRKPLQQQTSDPSTVTVHHGAAVAIGRRGLGTPIRRRPAGLRTQQRIGAHTPPARPERQSSSHGGAVVPAHPHTIKVCGSTGQHPPPAANTVRAAQDSLLITN